MLGWLHNRPKGTDASPGGCLVPGQEAGCRLQHSDGDGGAKGFVANGRLVPHMVKEVSPAGGVGNAWRRRRLCSCGRQ